MVQYEQLLIRKQADYLYQYLNISVLGIFLSISLFVFLLWDITAIHESLIKWYFFNLFILALRSISNVLYHNSSDRLQSINWIYLFVLGSCLNGILIAMLIFILPDHNYLYFTYILLFLSMMIVAAITSLGVMRQAFFTYLVTIAVPVFIFYLNHFHEELLIHLYGYLLIFAFSSMSMLRFNHSLLTAFKLELANQQLVSQLNYETDTRMFTQDELWKKRNELEELNITLENKVKEKTNELEALAFYDTLTQLPNRNSFYNYLSRTLTRNKLTREPFALFFIDLDEFKTVNDTLGHDFGDMLLIEAASRLRTSTRVDDFIARISGDEFTIIVKHVDGKAHLATIAQNIINTISQPYLFHETRAFISCSIGIAIFPDDGENASTLLKFSDLAMYQAKENGKNAFNFYHYELYEQKAKKFILVNELKTALKKNELYLVYQPQVHCHNEIINSMEVLLRWQNKKIGPVPTDKFIPLAEESNLILELEEFVLKTALTQVKYWNQSGKQQYTVSINISGIHFQRKDFVQKLERLLKQLDINPNILEIELTESTVMKNTRDNIDKLLYLQSLGIKVAVDDFGTGYSSMSYLKQLPINTLKIDRSFIEGIPGDHENKAITQAIIVLAQQFNINTIAEGVETQQQLTFLKEIDCQMIQGYFYYKPLTAEEFETEFNIPSSSQIA